MLPSRTSRECVYDLRGMTRRDARVLVGFFCALFGLILRVIRGAGGFF
ncbi:MAG: hypothetical protein LBQ66_03285 [Planctomycetaceae bacterium]|nr:hypothetical protein [Planctomycetaceae bacterium]